MAKHIWLQKKLTEPKRARARHIQRRLVSRYGWGADYAKRATIWAMESISQKGYGRLDFSFRGMAVGESPEEYADYRYHLRAHYIIRHSPEQPWIEHPEWAATYDRLVG